MASHAHNLAVAIVNEMPLLIHTLLRVLGAPPLPPGEQAAAPYPTDIFIMGTEISGDNIIALYDESKPIPMRPRSGVKRAYVLETQRGVSRQKRFTFPLYIAAVRYVLRCLKVTLIIITFSKQMAEWAGQSIEFGDSDFTPRLVLGPHNMPVIQSREEASNDPMLALASAAIHLPKLREEEEANAEHAAERVAESVAHVLAVSQALITLDLQEEAENLYKLFLRVLSKAAQRAVEEAETSVQSNVDPVDAMFARMRARWTAQAEARRDQAVAEAEKAKAEAVIARTAAEKAKVEAQAQAEKARAEADIAKTAAEKAKVDALLQAEKAKAEALAQTEKARAEAAKAEAESRALVAAAQARVAEAQIRIRAMEADIAQARFDAVVQALSQRLGAVPPDLLEQLRRALGSGPKGG